MCGTRIKILSGRKQRRIMSICAPEFWGTCWGIQHRKTRLTCHNNNNVKTRLARCQHIWIRYSTDVNCCLQRQLFWHFSLPLLQHQDIIRWNQWNGLLEAVCIVHLLSEYTRVTAEYQRLCVKIRILNRDEQRLNRIGYSLPYRVVITFCN